MKIPKRLRQLCLTGSSTARLKDGGMYFPGHAYIVKNMRRREAVMYQIYGMDSRHIRWLYFFLGGFFAGILVLNIWRDSFLQDMEFLSAASLSRLKFLEVDGGAFFRYVLRERLGTAILLCLLATTYAGAVSVSAYALWMGTMAGVFLSVASIRYGIRGIALALVSMMPHYLLLVPAYIMLMDWCCHLNMALYHSDRLAEAGRGRGKQYLIRDIPRLLVILGILIAGGVAESYVNPVLLSAFLKIF